MSKIITVKGREVLDSRGNPTVEAEVSTKDGLFRAMVPSGASTGVHEALELRDHQRRYLGKGEEQAMMNISTVIAKKLRGMEINQKKIDQTLLDLDGTEHKEKLGANAILAVSMAACKAGAAGKGMKLYEYIGKLYGITPNVMPLPLANVINGGKHAGQENDIQEHMIIPTGAKHIRDAIEMESEIYHYLGKNLKKRFGSSGLLIGDEGGYAPAQLKTMQERFDAMLKAIKQAGYEGKVKLGIDAAASEFFSNGKYTLGGKTYTADKLAQFYEDICDLYPLISIEDPFAEDDWGNWQLLTHRLGKKIQIVGDDLLVTNVKRIQKGVVLGAANAVLIKVNQIGTVSETLDAIKLAQKEKWGCIISHRSGETEDSFIADLAVGTNAGQSKFGAPARSDRNAKYNQLLRIEEDLGSRGKYFGKHL